MSKVLNAKKQKSVSDRGELHKIFTSSPPGHSLHIDDDDDANFIKHTMAMITMVIIMIPMTMMVIMIPMTMITIIAIPPPCQLHKTHNSHDDDINDNNDDNNRNSNANQTL